MVKQIIYHAEFENEDGNIINMQIDAPNLEDATIEASNIADEKQWEFLGIDEL